MKKHGTRSFVANTLPTPERALQIIYSQTLRLGFAARSAQSPRACRCYKQHEPEILAEFERRKKSQKTEWSIADIAIKNCSFYLPDHVRYDYLLEQPKDKNIARAMASVEEYKPELDGILPQELLDFAKKLKDEREKHACEGLTEDELELFDLIKRRKMTKAEEQKVKLAAARKLLHRLLEESPPVLVQDCYKDAQTRKIVRSAVEEVLDNELTETYDKDAFKEKYQSVFDTVLDYAIRGYKFAA